MPRTQSCGRLGFLLSAILLFASATHSQVPDPVVAAQAPQPGSEHSYIGLGAETVNPADGQVTFDLPIRTPAGRQLSFPFGIRYSLAENFYLTNFNTNMFNWAYRSNPTNVGGWSYDLPYLTAQTFAQNVWTTYSGYPLQADQHQCDAVNNFVFRGLDNRQYTLMLAGGAWNDAAYQSQNPNDCSGPYSVSPTSNTHGILATYQSNYSGWPLFPPVSVVDQSGTKYQFSTWGGGTPYTVNPGSPSPELSLAQTITDRNGNQIALSGNSYKDTLGRQVVSWTGPGQNPDQISVSGLSQNIVVHWGTTPGGGYPMTGSMLAGTAQCYVTTTGPPGGASAISEIDLPNGQSYKFTYHPTYGTLSEIQFPDGGSVTYNYALQKAFGITQGQWWFSVSGYQTPENCTVTYDIPVVTDRWVNDGQKNVLHQQFSYNIVSWGSNPWKTTTVTTTDLVTGQISKTIYTYGQALPDLPPYSPTPTYGMVPLETSVVYQNGSGNALRTLNQQWISIYSASGSQTVLNDGPTTQTMTTLRCYDSNEQMTQLYEYGFPAEGSYPGDPSCASSSGLPAAKGPLQRKTVTAYYNFMGGTPSTHIVNEPNSITVSNGSSNLKQVTYAYDVSNITPSGAATGLVAAPGLRGNATSVTQWLNTGGSSPVTTYTYYDTGQVQTMTDPRGNATTYSYLDNFATGTPPGQT